MIVTEAVRLPVPDGVNVTLIEQFALAASVALVAGHVFVRAKSLALLPATVMLEIVSGAVCRTSRDLRVHFGDSRSIFSGRSYCWMMTTSGADTLTLISTAFVGEIM